MTGSKGFVTAGCLIALWFSARPALAQYVPQFQGYSPYGQRARLNPYLNLLRQEEPDTIGYFLGTIPERERRYNDRLFSSQIRTLQQRGAAPLAPSSEEEIPPVPYAGKPIGSRSSASYFRNDLGAPINNHRAGIAQHHHRPGTGAGVNPTTGKPRLE